MSGYSLNITGIAEEDILRSVQYIDAKMVAIIRFLHGRRNWKDILEI